MVKNLVFPRIFLYYVALGFIKPGLLLFDRLRNDTTRRLNCQQKYLFIYLLPLHLPQEAKHCRSCYKRSIQHDRRYVRRRSLDEVTEELDYFYDYDLKAVFLRCSGHPTERFSSIEMGVVNLFILPRDAQNITIRNYAKKQNIDNLLRWAIVKTNSTELTISLAYEKI